MKPKSMKDIDVAATNRYIEQRLCEEVNRAVQFNHQNNKSKTDVLREVVIMKKKSGLSFVCEWCLKSVLKDAGEPFYKLYVYDDEHVICGDCYDRLEKINRSDKQ